MSHYKDEIRMFAETMTSSLGQDLLGVLEFKGAPEPRPSEHPDSYEARLREWSRQQKPAGSGNQPEPTNQPLEGERKKA